MSGRILDASWEVLLSGGFENFTFDRVARHAHIGKATIYSRFSNKMQLLGALLTRRLALRTAQLQAQGSDLPVHEAFRLRAADTMKMLFSPDGILTERLIDWLDQEGGGHSVRANAYQLAIINIAQSLKGLPIDPYQAARFWLEGLIGHAKVAINEETTSDLEIELWAADYTTFFFTGLRALD